MTNALKTTAVLAMLLSLTACAVVPPQVVYTGPTVAVGVRPAPYYGPYYASPGYGYRHWDRRW